MRYGYLVLVCLFALLAGCSSHDYTGKYSTSLDTGGEKNPMASALAGAMMGDLELKSDKTFTWSMMGAPVEGKWSSEGSQVTLTVEKAMGMAVPADSSNKPLVLTASSDGKTLTGKDPGGKTQGSFTFTKKDT